MLINDRQVAALTTLSQRHHIMDVHDGIDSTIVVDIPRSDASYTIDGDAVITKFLAMRLEEGR